MQFRRLTVPVILGVLWPLAAVAHMLNMYDTDRVAELRLAEGFVELRMQFAYKEFPGLNLRLAMDRDADDVVSNEEAAGFGAGFIDSVATGISLLAGGVPLELTPIREPVVEFYDSRRVIPQHCDITLEFSAPLQLAPGDTRELGLSLTGGGEWPYQGKLVLAVVAGRAVEVERISLPDGPPSGPEELQRLELACRLRSERELDGSAASGERDWRIVRYAQAYYFPRSMTVAPVDTVPSADGLSGSGSLSGDSHGAGLRERVMLYLERGRGGLATLWLILAASFAYGAVHALAPGHAKTLTAAYLVGSRHSWPHALVLAAAVTATHTGSILILAVITRLAWSDGVGVQTQAVLGVVSGLIVLTLGIQRLRGGGGHSHGHDHSHDHDHDHSHDHSHLPPAEESGYRQILWLGFAGGLAPCPGAIW
ncbi:MAG: hypothetical protein FVQ81_17070, partial [Candidatus Glassbacteria bacterium]|nr:hypothetical protein [Candidatus Glassbacteria bacterium]